MTRGSQLFTTGIVAVIYFANVRLTTIKPFGIGIIIFVGTIFSTPTIDLILFTNWIIWIVALINNKVVVILSLNVG